jgi:hypothetical protein
MPSWQSLPVWGTYYGGGAGDWISDVEVDGGGNVAFVGHTTSTTGIATAGAHQTTWSGEDDAFVTHFDTDGNQLWGTYYGDIKLEYGLGLAFDPSGDLFITGATYSTLAISTSGAHQETFGGGFSDGYIAKFDVTLTSVDELGNTSDGIILYPNPSSGSCTLEVLGWKGEELNIEIVNMLGAVVHRQSASSPVFTISPDGLTTGTYLVKVTTSQGIQVKKWVVRK